MDWRRDVPADHGRRVRQRRRGRLLLPLLVAAVAVTEVPLLYAVGGQDRFDKVVVITAPTKLREARANVALAGRSDRLLPDREKVKKADFSYVNTGSLEELDGFVRAVMEELTPN